MKTGKY